MSLWTLSPGAALGVVSSVGFGRPGHLGTAGTLVGPPVLGRPLWDSLSPALPSQGVLGEERLVSPDLEVRGPHLLTTEAGAALPSSGCVQAEKGGGGRGQQAGGLRAD